MHTIVWGKVRKGSQRGKQLGFPTANIVLHKDVPEGVYVAQAKVGNKCYDAVAFIGASQTFNEHQKKVEVHMLYCTKNVYDQWLTVQLLQKIRSNKKFKSVKELKSAIKKDIHIAQQYFQHS